MGKGAALTDHVIHLACAHHVNIHAKHFSSIIWIYDMGNSDTTCMACWSLFVNKYTSLYNTHTHLKCMYSQIDVHDNMSFGIYQ